MWLFLQICLRIMASSNQQLQFFSKFSLIVLITPRPNHISIRHEVIELTREGMWQSAIAGCMGLTCAPTNRIFRRHAATGALGPGKSMGGLLGRPPLIKTMLCSGWSDTITSKVLGSWWHGWRSCMERGLIEKKHQQSALVPCLPCPYTHKEAHADCQPPLSPLGVGTEVAEPKNGPLAACHFRWWVKIPTLLGRWQS